MIAGSGGEIDRRVPDDFDSEDAAEQAEYEAGDWLGTMVAERMIFIDVAMSPTDEDENDDRSDEIRE